MTKAMRENGVLISVSKLMESFKISGRQKCRLGVKSMQNMKYEDLSPLRKQLVARIYKNIMEKVARMFLPCDVSILVEKGVGLFDITSRNKCFLVNCLGKYRKGGIEKRLFRSMIAGSLSKYEAKRVLLRDVT